MANDFTRAEMTFYEQALEAFSPALVAAANATVFSPNMTDVERSGLTIRRPVPYIAEVSTGIDVSAAYKDLKELTVPVSLADGDIKNHAFKLNAVTLNDPRRLKEAARAAAQALATQVDTDVQNKVRLFGSLVMTETGAFTDYDHLAKGETAFQNREISITAERALILNPKASRKMANGLAQRATDNQRDMSAYERSILPAVGGFDTFKGNVITSITGSAVAGVTVNGANQRKTPTVFDGTNGTIGGAADNRFMALVVSAATLLNGDAFTIAGVNSVGMISKKDTGELQTFRVISGGGTANLVISPAIIPVDQAATEFKKYGNVTTTPANGAAITLLNTDTVQPSLFYTKRGVEIFAGRLNVDELGASVSIRREVTESGIEVIFAKQGNVDDLSCKYRLTCWSSAHVLDPQHAGIYLPDQNVAFG